MRIVMYVVNDVTHDSRVLREAASLAAAGHGVTIVGASPTGDDATGGSTVQDGFTILRVGIPTGTRWWMTYVRTPWRSLPAAARSLGSSLAAGPAGWSRAAALLAGLLLSIPWVLVRAPWYGLVNRLLKRPVRLGLDYIRSWRVETLGWAARAVAVAPAADVHHAHDMEALPAARAAAARDGARYVYDSHEIFMAWGKVLQQPWWLRWAMTRWEQRMARGASAVITVNEPIAAELRRRLGVRRIVAIYNCARRWDPPDPPEDRIRRAAAIPPGADVVLCHGGFQPGRGLDETAAALAEPGLERAHLVFLGYRQGVVEPILASATLAGRVHFLPAVPPGEVTAWVAGADLDVMAILPSDRNSELSTPNKLFESLAAGVPVVSSDLPERRRIICDDPAGPLGALCEPTRPASIAAAIRSILELDPLARSDLRSRCLRAAHDRWNWEMEARKLIAVYADLAAPR